MKRPFELVEAAVECKHRCKDKEKCKHKCCKNGVLTLVQMELSQVQRPRVELVLDTKPAGDLSFPRDIANLVFVQLDDIISTARLMLTCRHLYSVAKPYLDQMACQRYKEEDADAFYLIYQESLSFCDSWPSYSALIPRCEPGNALRRKGGGRSLGDIIDTFGSSLNLRNWHTIAKTPMTQFRWISIFLRHNVVLPQGCIDALGNGVIRWSIDTLSIPEILTAVARLTVARAAVKSLFEGFVREADFPELRFRRPQLDLKDAHAFLFASSFRDLSLDGRDWNHASMLRDVASAEQEWGKLFDVVENYWERFAEGLKSAFIRPSTKLRLEEVAIRYMKHDPRANHWPLVINAHNADRAKVHRALNGICSHESYTLSDNCRYLFCGLHSKISMKGEELRPPKLVNNPIYIWSGKLPFIYPCADYFPNPGHLSTKETVLFVLDRIKNSPFKFPLEKIYQ